MPFFQTTRISLWALPFKIAMSGWAGGRAGVGRRPLWLTFLKNPTIMPLDVFLVHNIVMEHQELKSVEERNEYFLIKQLQEEQNNSV